MTLERTRALLRQCCQHGCGGGNDHACDRIITPDYSIVADPGPLEPRGPLHPEVLARVQAICGTAVTRRNRVRLLVDGVQTYAAMLDLVQEAEREILFENFIFRSDAVGVAFAEALRERAQEGVDVRVLHDPFGSLMSLRAPIGFRFHRSPATVRVYNPPRPAPAFFRWGRDHRKLVVRDRRRAIIGGMCLADVWAGNCVSMCTWRDSAAWVEGDAAAACAHAFGRQWSRGRSFTPRRAHSAELRSDAPEPVGDVGCIPVRVLADEPGDRHVERALAEIFAAAESEILITNPYVVLPQLLADELEQASRRGIDTRLLLPRFSNHHLVGLSSEHLLGRLLEAGIGVWRWTGPLIHAKTIVIDRRWSLVGSSNLDPLSLRRNAEINLEIHGESFGAHLADLFLHDLESSQRFTHDDWITRSRVRCWTTRLATAGRSWQ